MEKYITFVIISCFILVFAPYPVVSYSQSEFSKESSNKSNTDSAIEYVTKLFNLMLHPMTDSIVDNDTGFKMTFPQGWNGTGTDMFFMRSAIVSPNGFNMSNIMTHIITEISKQNNTRDYPAMTEEQMQPIYQQMVSEMVNDMIASYPVTLSFTILDKDSLDLFISDPILSPKPSSLSEFLYETNEIDNCSIQSVNYTKLNSIPAENSISECTFDFHADWTNSLIYVLATNDKIIFIDYSATLDQYDKYYEDVVDSLNTIELEDPIDPLTILK